MSTPQPAKDAPREASAIRTFLIADVRGYTRFTHQHGDEAAARLTGQFADVTTEAVEAHGGEVVELRGDEVLAVFGSVRRAIRAAVELQEVLVAESSEGSASISAGVGLDAGEAVPVAGGYRGRALNLAARLCARAQPGEVLASSQVVHLAGAVDGVSFSTLGQIELKGLESPVEVISLTSDAVSGVVFRPERPGARMELARELDQVTPLIGRESELRRLRWMWRRARAGHGGVCLVSGPSGIGKTRLAGELATEVHSAGWTVVYGRGAGPVDECLDALHAMQSAPEPGLLVLDDIDVCGGTVLDRFDAALTALASRALLVVATGREVTSRVARIVDQDRLGSAERVELRGLDAAAVTAIANLYGPGRHSDLPIADVLDQTAGVPAALHRLVSAFLTERAAEGVGRAVTQSAERRPELASADAAVVTGVADLELVRERSRLYASETDGSPVVCPFKGLSSYGPDDAEYFFGRERLVAELTARVIGATFLGVVGPSGSGKSSAVKAGLMPALASGVIPSSERWQQTLIRPGEHPNGALSHALDRQTGGDDSRRVLIVDQFEELFTACPDEEERRAFTASLIELTADPAWLVVVALRADYFGRCAAYPGLARLLSTTCVLVGPMDEEELRRVIEMPARRAGLVPEPELVTALVDEVTDQPGALPLLSTKLLELWQHREGRTLSFATYERTGGVRAAVAGLAEATYMKLSEDQRALVRPTFLRLAIVDEGDAVARRRASIDEFDASSTDAAAVLDAFVDARLVTASEGHVEVAHEALLREWPRLRDWLQEDAHGAQLHHHMIQTARGWDERGRDRGELYRGARLSAALDWTARHDPALNQLEREFLQASRDVHQRELRRLRLLLAGAAVLLVFALIAGAVAYVQRGSAQRAATVADARGLGAEALTTLVLDRSLLLAREAIHLDNSPATRADLFSALLRGRDARWQLRVPGPFASSRGVNQIAASPDGRTLAIGNDAGAVMLYDAATPEPTRIATMHPLGDKGVTAIAYSPDGRLLAVAGRTASGQAGEIALISTETHRPTIQPIRISRVVQIGRLAFSPNSQTLAVLLAPADPNAFGAADTDVRLLDPSNGKWLDAPVLLGRSYNAINDLSYANRGTRLVASLWVPPPIPGGRVDTLNATTLAVIPAASFPLANVGQAVVSPDGKTMAIAEDDGSVRFRNQATGRTVVAAGVHSQGIWSAGFTPDGKTLITTADDHTVALWNVRAAREQQVLYGHGDQVYMQAIPRTGHMLYTGSVDGTVIAWDLSGNRLLDQEAFIAPPTPQYTSQDTAAAAISPNGTWLAVSPKNGIVRLWNLHTLTPGPVLHGYTSGGQPTQIGFMDFSPNGRWLAADQGAGSAIVVWNWHTSHIVRRFQAPGHQSTACASNPKGIHCAGYSLEFSPNSGLLASGNSPGGARIWNMRTRRSTFIPTPAVVTDVVWGPDGRRLALWLWDPSGRYQIWRTIGHPTKPAYTIPAIQGNFGHGLAFSPNGNRFVVSNTGHLEIHDTSTGALINKLPMSVQSDGGVLDWSPDGTTIAATAGDGVELWDVKSGTQLGTLPLTTKPFESNVMFTPDSHHLAVVTNDGRLAIWDLNAADWATAACQIAGRNLTQVEWKRYVPDRPYATTCPR